MLKQLLSKCYVPFLVIACTIDIISPDIANVFQIWSTLAGSDELAEIFEPIRNGEIL